MKIQSIIFSYILLFIPLWSFAQAETIIEAQLVDPQNKQALAYVNIGIIGTSIGTVSAVDGTFKLYLPKEIAQEQIVRFSYIGYETKDYTIASLQHLTDSIIYLNKEPVILQTVEVRPLGTTSKVIGNKRTKPRMVTNFSISKQPNQNLGAAIGRKFKLGKKTTFLKNFRFFVAANDFETIRFSVNIYSTTKGKPDQLIHTQNIVTELQQHSRGWVNVDLSPYNIYTSGTIIAAITWIHHSPKGQYLQLPLTLPAIGATHYYRYGSQNKWKRFRGMSTAMQLEIIY